MKGLKLCPPDAPETICVRESRPETLEQLRQLMASLVSDLSNKSDLSDKSGKSDIKAEVAANVMISLINQETFLLGRQIARLANDFEKEGGFTERLYRIRKNAQKKGDD